MNIRNKKKTAVITAAVLVLALATALALMPGMKRTAGREKVTIAVAVQPISAPVYIAHARGFFEREGLQVSLQPFWAGKDALASVIKGKAQFGTVAETPIMFAALKGVKFYVIATIADSNRYMKVVARRDRGIGRPEDLKGKRVGVSMGTNAGYFLDALLTYNGIKRTELRIVPMEPERMAEALVQGVIDAAVSWNPHLGKQQKALGSNGITFSNSLVYKVWWNIVSGQEYARAHPGTVEKLLRALILAERYIQDNPDEASAIVSGFVGQGRVTLSDYTFDVRLGQALILSLEEQARWAIRTGLTDRERVPNFLDLLYTRGLEAVAPASVMIMHK